MRDNWLLSNTHTHTYMCDHSWHRIQQKDINKIWIEFFDDNFFLLLAFWVIALKCDWICICSLQYNLYWVHLQFNRVRFLSIIKKSWINNAAIVLLSLFGCTSHAYVVGAFVKKFSMLAYKPFWFWIQYFLTDFDWLMLIELAYIRIFSCILITLWKLFGGI